MPIVSTGGGIVPVTSWTGTSANLWYHWNTTYRTTTTATTTANVIWTTWTSTGIYTMPWTTTPQRTEDEWAVIHQRQSNKARARNRLHAAARAEGSKLLAMILDEVALATLAAERFFDVVGASGQLWRVHYGTSGNVRALDADGHEIMAICAHPALWDNDGQGHLPTEDVLAAQALHLMHDDSAFLQRANVHRGNPRSLSLVPALRAS